MRGGNSGSEMGERGERFLKFCVIKPPIGTLDNSIITLGERYGSESCL